MLQSIICSFLVDWSVRQLEILHDRDLRGLGNLYRRLHAQSLCADTRYGLPSSSSHDPVERELIDALVSLSGDVTHTMKLKAISRAVDVIMARVELVCGSIPSSPLKVLKCTCIADESISHTTRAVEGGRSYPPRSCPCVGTRIIAHMRHSSATFSPHKDTLAA